MEELLRQFGITLLGITLSLHPVSPVLCFSQLSETSQPTKTSQLSEIVSEAPEGFSRTQELEVSNLGGTSPHCVAPLVVRAGLRGTRPGLGRARYYKYAPGLSHASLQAVSHHDKVLQCFQGSWAFGLGPLHKNSAQVNAHGGSRNIWGHRPSLVLLFGILDFFLLCGRVGAIFLE